MLNIEEEHEDPPRFVPGDLVDGTGGVIIGAIGTYERLYLPSKWLGIVVSNDYIDLYGQKRLLILFDCKLYVVWRRAFLLQKL